LTAPPAAAQAVAPTAREVIASIQSHSAVQLPANTVDTFKAGDPETKVTGIAVTMMATLDVLQRAAAKGLNLIITHEPTFYSHRDTTGILENENDRVYAAKMKFIRDHKLVVWRFHDTPHRMSPDLIEAGVIDALGWTASRNAGNPRVFDVERTTLGALAAYAARRLGAGAPRILGDPRAVVSRVAVTEGFPGFAANRAALQPKEVDALIMGEDHEWETIAYASDAITAGLIRGVVVLGHTPSEQAGMQRAAQWMKTFVTGLPIEMIPSRDPFARTKSQP
jgi:putative NIF3 family GTP cyclohydrolase 1 type 2